MYLNVFQQYIQDLLYEYGPLLKRQLLLAVNSHFGSKLHNLDGYTEQMCRFGDFCTGFVGNDEYLGFKGEEPNIDMIRSFDVMLAFLPNVRWHRKSRDFISIRFLAGTYKNEKEICVIPVKYGTEKVVTDYVSDTADDGKCEITVFLLEDKAQMQKINIKGFCKFAVIGKNGVEFYRA